MRFLGNNRGSALIASMIAGVLVVGASTVAYRNYVVNHDSVRVARIRSLMNVVEQQVRRRALQPEAYINCSNTGVTSCEINRVYYSSLTDLPVPGAKEADGSRCSGCGMMIIFNPQYNGAEGPLAMPANRMFRARVIYEGAEARRLKPIDVEVEVPTEILQRDEVRCQGREPFFAGFEPGSGAPICRGFENNPCPAGHFVRGVDITRRQVNCAPLPTEVSCGSANKLQTLTWNNGVLNRTCSDLQDPPFNSWGESRVQGDYPPPDRHPASIVNLTNNIPVTVTVVATATATSTNITTNTVTVSSTVTTTSTTTSTYTPPPPAGPVCSMRSVALGASPQGSSTAAHGYMACTRSCQAAFGWDSQCGGGCYSGYRNWMFCTDCRADRLVCE